MTRRGFVGAVAGFVALCAGRVTAAARRKDTALHANGPDARAHLDRMRTGGSWPLEPREETFERIDQDLRQIKGCFAKYRHYGPFAEPRYLTRLIDKGIA